MPESLAKLIPSAVLIAILGYLSWPYFDPAPAGNGSSGKLPEVAADLLRPAAPPATKRDPFGNSVRFELGETKNEKSGRRTTGNKPAGAKPGKTSHAQSGAAGKSKAGEAATHSASATEVKTADRNTMASLVLNATLLDGQKSIALINGRAYRPGEALATSGSEKAPVLVEIHHHGVILLCEGKPVELRYPDTPAGAKSDPPAAKGSAKKKSAKPPAARRPAGSSSPVRPTATARPPQAR
jgi:hypothetical protein